MFSYDLENMPAPFSYDDSSDSLFDSYIDSSCLDQSFCSNFSCCGQNLPDLHRLLEHFEEEHVLPLPHDDRPLYSSPVYAHPRPAGAHASYIISFPQPDPPLQPVSHPIHPPPRALPALDVHRLPAVPDLTFSPLSTSSSATTSCYPSPTLGEPLCLPPALFSRTRTPPPSRDPASGSDDEGEDAPKARSRRRAVGPHRTAKQHPSARRVDPIARSRPLAHARTPERAPLPPSAVSGSGLGHRKKDGREKQYKCPHPGCMKSYLNPNGLKYHLEKGTCTNADARSRGAIPPPPPTQTTQNFSTAPVPALKINVIDVPSNRQVDVDVEDDEDEDGDEDGELQSRT